MLVVVGGPEDRLARQGSKGERPVCVPLLLHRDTCLEAEARC